MTPVRIAAALALCQFCWGARCTTVLDPRMLREYERYIARAERAMPARFDAGELSWVPAASAKEAAAKLASGKPVRWNVSDAAVNRRIAAQNATVIHWIGAIVIPRAGLVELTSILEDYDQYQRMYQPMIYECRSRKLEEAARKFDVTMGLHSTFRFAALFPQHYSFRTQARIEYSGSASGLSVHLRSGEIRESDSGVPGRDDFLQPYRDHGIMWALNAYWRARPRGPDLYLEFETITLARSVQAFACRLGFVPVPKSVVADAMDAIPSESVTVILEGTRVECARRSGPRTGEAAGQ